MTEAGLDAAEDDGHDSGSEHKAACAGSGGSKPTRMRRRDRRKVRKEEAKVAERLERDELVSSDPEVVAPATAPRARPSHSTLLKESMRELERTRAKVVGPGGVETSLVGLRRVPATPAPTTYTAQPRVGGAHVASAIGAAGGGFGVQRLTASTPAADRTREGYPAGGRHYLSLTAAELRRVMRAAGPASVAGFVRLAVLSAAGVRRHRPVKEAPHPKAVAPRKVAFTLTRAARTAVDRARRDRPLGRWALDAVRAAAGMRTPWTLDAEAVLRAGFRRWPVEALERALPGKSPAAMTAHADVLGLCRGLSDDRVSLHRAAAAAGYDDKTLKRLLVEAGVEMAPTATATEATGAGRRRIVVRAADVARAVRARGATETLSDAARRLECNIMTLRREVLADRPPALSALSWGTTWRLPPSAYDAAFARITARRDRGLAIAEERGIPLLGAYAINAGRPWRGTPAKGER